MRGKHARKSARRREVQEQERQASDRRTQSDRRQRLAEANARTKDAQAALVELSAELHHVDEVLAPAVEAERCAGEAEGRARTEWRALHRVVRQFSEDISMALARVETRSGSFIKKSSAGSGVDRGAVDAIRALDDEGARTDFGWNR